MTLLICVFAAVASTAVWYRHAPEDPMKVSVLCWLFWGASLLWFVDGCFAYAAQGAACFSPEPAALLGDLVLGLSVAALALVIWIVCLLITDPRGALRALLTRNRQ